MEASFFFCSFFLFLKGRVGGYPLKSVTDVSPFLLRCRMSLASFSVTAAGATTSSSLLVMACRHGDARQNAGRRGRKLSWMLRTTNACSDTIPPSTRLICEARPLKDPQGQNEVIDSTHTHTHSGNKRRCKHTHRHKP